MSSPAPQQPAADEHNAILAAIRRMGIAKDEMSGHGFRAMARTILDEVLGFRPDFIEHQLAHAVRNPNGRAYNRTAHLAEPGNDAGLGGLLTSSERRDVVPILKQMRRPVVSASVRITHRVGELVLDEIRPKAQHLVQDGSRHGAKSVAAHLILGDAHATNGSENGVVAHRPLAAAGAGEDITGRGR